MPFHKQTHSLTLNLLHFVCDCPTYRELREVATREVRSVCAARSHVMPSWWQAVVNPDLVLLGEALKQVRAIALRCRRVGSDAPAHWRRRFINYFSISRSSRSRSGYTEMLLLLLLLLLLYAEESVELCLY